MLIVREENLSLYAISTEIAELQGVLFDPETGEVDEAVEARLDELAGGRTEKIKNCIRFVKNNRCNAEMLKAESKALAERAKAFQARADSTEKYLDGLTSKDTDSLIMCEAGELLWTKSTRTVIDDKDKLPIGFFVVERKPDAKKIKEALLGADENLKNKFNDIAHLDVGFKFKVK